MSVDTSDNPRVANQVPERAIVAEADDNARMKQIRERFDIMMTAWSINRDQAINDDKFVGGEQWEEIVRKEREEEGRPMHTYNLLLTYVNQIVNGVRQDWPQLRVRPVEQNAGPLMRVQNIQGTQDYSMADVYMGIIRNIEHISRAEQAYDTAVEHSVQHGFGYIRAQPVWTRDDSFEQEIRIMRVKNSYSVLLDPTAQEADYSDMQDAFIHSMIQKDAFERKWPDARATSFDSSEMGNTYEGWYDREMVRIAEYFWIDYIQDEILQLSNGMVVYRKDVDKVLDDLDEELAIHIKKTRKVKRPVCMWQKMTANDILEGPIRLPTKYIPIFPVLGKELIIDGETRYHSAIRHAKDAQKAYNYWMTAATETVALAPRAPWILTAQQILGHEMAWEAANRKNQPYLLYNHIEGVNPPQRVTGGGAAAAELQQAATQQAVMQDIIGLHEADMGIPSNERSGVAIRERAARGDLATFVYPDNLSRAVEHLGRVLVEMIPAIYDTQRVMRIRLPDDTEDFVEINKSVVDDKTGETTYVHDISYGRYDVVIDTGPSFQTQRQEAADQIIAVMEKLPPDKVSMVAHLLVKNMDFPGAEDVYDIMRKLLPDELKTQDEKAKDLPSGFVFDEDGQPVSEETGEPMPPPQPSPEEAAMQKELEARNKESDAKIATADAKTKGAEADIAEAQQKMAELQSGGGDAGGEQLQGSLDQNRTAILQEVKQMLDKIMAEHEENVDAKITDAVVDTLARVKRAYDPKFQARDEAQITPNAPAPSPTNAPAVLELRTSDGVDRLEELEIERDEDGRMLRVVPHYEEEAEAD